MILCPDCAFANLPNTLFCDRCTAPLSPTLAPKRSEQRPRLRCHLLEDNTELDLPAGPAITFGRSSQPAADDPHVDLTPYGAAGAGVSRQHARLLWRESQYYLEDLASLNGTFIDEVRLPPHRPVPLPAGAVVRFGRLRLRFEAIEDRNPTPIRGTSWPIV